MAQILNQTTETSTNSIGMESYLPEEPQKKKSGCSCCLVGCLVILALILLPLVGAGLYIATISEAQWGGKIVMLLQNKDFSNGLKQSIQNSDKLDTAQKQTIIQMYDQFLDKYKGLPTDKQELINKNLAILIKKVVFDSESLEQEIPQEYLEIISILQTEVVSEHMKTLQQIQQQLEQNSLPEQNTNTKTPEATPQGELGQPAQVLQLTVPKIPDEANPPIEIETETEPQTEIEATPEIEINANKDQKADYDF